MRCPGSCGGRGRGPAGRGGLFAPAPPRGGPGPRGGGGLLRPRPGGGARGPGGGAAAARAFFRPAGGVVRVGAGRVGVRPVRGRRRAGGGGERTRRRPRRWTGLGRRVVLMAGV